MHHPSTYTLMLVAFFLGWGSASAAAYYVYTKQLAFIERLRDEARQLRDELDTVETQPVRRRRRGRPTKDEEQLESV